MLGLPHLAAEALVYELPVVAGDEVVGEEPLGDPGGHRLLPVLGGLPAPESRRFIKERARQVCYIV